MKVLLSAYACEPGRGSEPGAGWTWTRAAAIQHDVWLLTRTNNRAAIERALIADPHLRLQPIYLDLPPWARWWKGGGRGARIDYLLWQVLAGKVARRLHREHRFDVAHHLTFAIDSMPAGVIGIPGLPSVWGPVGGAAPYPWALRRWLGVVGMMTETARFAVSGLARHTFGRSVARRATLVIAQNQTVRNSMIAERVIVEPNVALDVLEFGVQRVESDAAGRNAMFVGRLVRLKCVRLAMSVLTNGGATGWTLTIVGDGPDRKSAERFARKAGIGDRVHFVGNLPRSEVLNRLKTADVLLFTSAHDSAPWSVGEAMLSGVPVLALDLCGPAELIRRSGAGACVRPSTHADRDLADHLGTLPRVPDVSFLFSAERLPQLLQSWYRVAAEGELVGGSRR